MGSKAFGYTLIKVRNAITDYLRKKNGQPMKIVERKKGQYIRSLSSKTDDEIQEYADLIKLRKEAVEEAVRRRGF